MLNEGDKEDNELHKRADVACSSNKLNLVFGKKFNRTVKPDHY